jgi:putative transposase
VAEGIGTLVVGKNPLWKQKTNMGKRGNQNFVFVPHARFIAMLTYRAELVGIRIKITEESYTSTASFLDADPLPAYGSAQIPPFSGKRVKRGLYRAANGRHLNADVNGSYNIIRKVLPDAFAGKGIAGAAVHPVQLAVRTKRAA